MRGRFDSFNQLLSGYAALALRYASVVLPGAAWQHIVAASSALAVQYHQPPA